MHPTQQPQQQLHEGLEPGDLARLVDTEVGVDEYKSKIGTDEEIVVVSFSVQGKDPALDLVSFIEKSYDWVLDSDLSSGELEDGSYIVFVELDRNSEVAANLVQMFADLVPLTGIDIQDWTIQYHKPSRRGTANIESLENLIPNSPDAYRRLQRKQQVDIDQLKNAAGVEVNTQAPKNDFTESLRIASGMR